MGSRARVVLFAPDEESAAAAAAAAFDEMDRLNAVLSDYDPDSEAMRLCRTHGRWVAASPDLLRVLAASRQVWQDSEGAFDPTVGPLSLLWRDARREGRIPDPASIEDALERVGMPHVRLDPRRGRVRLERPGMRLDFGGIGKGYAADRALETLRALGHASSLVDLGGDIAVGAHPPGDHAPWTIQVETPAGPIPLMPTAGVGVATSGARFQFVEWEGARYSHIIDPRTGLGVTDPVQITVVAESAALADALASAASVLGREGLPALRARYPDARIDLVDEKGPGDSRPGLHEN